PADNSGPIFVAEPLQKVQNDDDNYNVFDNDREHPEQPESVNEPYPVEQDEHNIIIDSLDMSYDREQDDQDDTNDLVKERDLLASLIEKLKCEIDDSKNRNKFLKSSNKALVDNLKGEIEDFKTKNKSSETLNNHFKEANNELSKTNQLMFKDLKKFQAELDRYHDVNYASKVAIDCAKAKGDLMHASRECQKLKRAKDAAYHKEKMLLDPADNSGPIFDAEPLQKVQNDDDNYNVFDNDREHPEQPESVNEPYPVEQDEHNIIIDSLDMSYDREQDDQDDNNELVKNVICLLL
ncbi:hypothetical protein Tco_1441333, partial [Tanacetum coccineum]